jgi:hypothetical protein
MHTVELKVADCKKSVPMQRNTRTAARGMIKTGRISSRKLAMSR